MASSANASGSSSSSADEGGVGGGGNAAALVDYRSDNYYSGSDAGGSGFLGGLEGGGDDDDDLDDELLAFPDFPPDCTSLLAVHLSQPLFEKLIRLSTSSGVTLQDCIISGVEFPDNHVGVYAGDAECLVLFEPLFGPIVSELHDFDLLSGPGGDVDGDADGAAGAAAAAAAAEGGGKHPASPLEAEGVDALPVESVIAARVRFARNVAGLSLTTQMTGEQRSDVEQTMAGVFEVKRRFF